jgi:aspartyl-tRNA(Asn)/glutamyl-tRNA(Gln) amidotransferase subunit A
MMNLQNIEQTQQLLLNKSTSCEAIIKQCLQNIKESANKNAFIEVFDEEAIELAKIIDKKIQSGEKLGRLFGIVISIKDNICYANHYCSAGSKILSTFKSTYNATAIQLLLDEDAIIIGRTNCDEFGMGSETKNEFYGDASHFDDNEKIPGGSSGGAALSVALHACHVALGSDTGGSVRQPAAFSGLIGYKPTYGVISRFGLIAYASSFDVIGLIARHNDDILKVFEILAQRDKNDSTSVDLSMFANKKNHKNKIAYFKQIESDNILDSDTKSVFEAEIEKIKTKGVSVEAIDFPMLQYAIPAYYVLTTAEASSNLSRYNGAHFGWRAKKYSNLDEMYTRTRSEGFGTEVKRRLLLGTFVLSSGYYDNYYAKAQKTRRLIQQELNSIFESYDYIICPVSPRVAWNKQDTSIDPLMVYWSDIFTVLSNLAGIPTICYAYKSDKNSYVGIQYLSKSFSDIDLIKEKL